MAPATLGSGVPGGWYAALGPVVAAEAVGGLISPQLQKVVTTAAMHATSLDGLARILIRFSLARVYLEFGQLAGGPGMARFVFEVIPVPDSCTLSGLPGDSGSGPGRERGVPSP